jgi:hypothetical protein
MFRCPAEPPEGRPRTGRLYGHHRGAPRATRPSRGRSRSPEKVRSAPARRQTQEPVLGDPEPDSARARNSRFEAQGAASADRRVARVTRRKRARGGRPSWLPPRCMDSESATAGEAEGAQLLLSGERGMPGVLASHRSESATRYEADRREFSCSPRSNSLRQGPRRVRGLAVTPPRASPRRCGRSSC